MNNKYLCEDLMWIIYSYLDPHNKIKMMASINDDKSLLEYIDVRREYKIVLEGKTHEKTNIHCIRDAKTMMDTCCKSYKEYSHEGYETNEHNNCKHDNCKYKNKKREIIKRLKKQYYL